MNTAFIGLDYIHDIVHPEGRIARATRHVADRGVIDDAVVVLEDACAAAEDAEHDASMKLLRTLATVTTAQELGGLA